MHVRGEEEELVFSVSEGVLCGPAGDVAGVLRARVGDTFNPLRSVVPERGDVGFCVVREVLASWAVEGRVGADVFAHLLCHFLGPARPGCSLERGFEGGGVIHPATGSILTAQSAVKRREVAPRWRG